MTRFLRLGAVALQVLAVDCAGQDDDAADSSAVQEAGSDDGVDSATQGEPASPATAASLETPVPAAELVPAPSAPSFTVEGISNLPVDGESVVLSLRNASTETIYVLGQPEGVAWRVGSVSITSNCAYISCPLGGVSFCPLVGMVCGLSSVGVQPVQPGETFEFEWKFEFELLNFTCDQYPGQCEHAHAISAGTYEVSIDYGLSYTSGLGLDRLQEVTTLTTTLSFPEERRVEFVAE